MFESHNIPAGFLVVPQEITDDLKTVLRRHGISDCAQVWTELLNAAQLAVEYRPALPVRIINGFRESWEKGC